MTDGPATAPAPPPQPRRVCILQGHPHATGGHLGHQIADAYASGARTAGCTVETVDIVAMDLSPLRDPAGLHERAAGPVHDAQEAVVRASHVMIVYPMWFGTMPAHTKAFIEHFGRARFAYETRPNAWPVPHLAGRSARIIMTMSTPSLAYRVVGWASGTRWLELGTFRYAGMKPVRTTVFGGIDEPDQRRRALAEAERLGRRDGA